MLLNMLVEYMSMKSAKISAPFMNTENNLYEIQIVFLTLLL
jgi:hypothetical protein